MVGDNYVHLARFSSPYFVAVELGTGTAPGHTGNDAQFVLGRRTFRYRHVPTFNGRLGNESVPKNGPRQGEGGGLPAVYYHPVGLPWLKRRSNGLHGVKFHHLLVAGNGSGAGWRRHQRNPDNCEQRPWRKAASWQGRRVAGNRAGPVGWADELSPGVSSARSCP